LSIAVNSDALIPSGHIREHERLAALRFGSKRDRAMFEDVAAARLRAYGRLLALWDVFMGAAQEP
jgi:hypothetical protein